MKFLPVAPVFLSLNLFAASSLLPCTEMIGTQTSCSPYDIRFYKAKVVKRNGMQELLVDKKRVQRKRQSAKVVTVKDLIERYKEIYPSTRSDYYYQRLHSDEDYLKLAPKAKPTVKPITPHQKRVEKSPSKKIDKSKNLAKEGSKTPKREIVDLGLYEVKKGDSVTWIAKRFGIDKKEIYRLNGINEKTLLRVGKKIKLPLSQERIDAIDSGVYTIKPGDTLIAIAKKFGLDPKALAKFNRIKNSTQIRAGDRIKLPLPHIVESFKKERIAKEKERRRVLAAKKRKENAKTRRKKHRFVKAFGKRKLRVTATAYTSHVSQTDSSPFLAAWNNRLRPGMKVIAVSRDLITKYGLGNGAKVKIGGLPGIYTVRDKMNKRFRRRIDIYMGLDRKRALRWGRRSVVIYF